MVAKRLRLAYDGGAALTLRSAAGENGGGVRTVAEVRLPAGAPAGATT